VENNLTNQLLEGEGLKLEYKREIPQPNRLARLMASFANTEGGMIIIGVNDDGTVVGIPDDAPVQKNLMEAFELLRPHPLMNYHFDKIYGKRVFVIEIQKYPAPILTEDQRYYTRKEANIVLAEENLVNALVAAVPEIKPNILNSLGVKERDTKKAENAAEFTEIVHEKLEEINLKQFNEDLLESMKHTKDQLAMRRRERIQQTNITYYVSLVCLILSVLFVFVGIILIFISKLPGAELTTVSSVVSSIVSGSIFAFNKQANDREYEDLKGMKTLEKSYDAMGYISYIDDAKMRNELMSDLVRKIFLEN
jgi:Putative DNA-binding domain